MSNPITDSIPVAVDVSGPGDHVIRAGEPGKWMRIFRIVLTLTRPDPEVYGDVVFKSGSTVLGGPLQLKDGAVITLEFNQRRWLMTDDGEDLVLNLGGAGRCSGALTLMVEDA
jgi:hypothetical protein